MVTIERCSLALALVAAIWLVCWPATGLSQVKCNKRNSDPNTVKNCNADYPATTYCTNWGVNDCNGQQGTQNPSVPQSWARGCLAPNPANPNNDCATMAKNCLQKYWCTWDGVGCKIGMPLNPAAYYTETTAYSRNCVPY